MALRKLAQTHKKVTSTKTLRPFTRRERDQRIQENRQMEFAKPKKPAPLLLLITTKDIPDEEGRGMLFWKRGRLSQSLMYELVKKTTPKGRTQLDLDLFGYPITHVGI